MTLFTALLFVVGFASSNPGEVDGFFSGRKNPEHKSSGRDFKLSKI